MAVDDPKRAQLLEACQKLVERTNAMRDYGMNPGGAWLAKSELGKISQLVADLEKLLQDIKQQDLA